MASTPGFEPLPTARYSVETIEGTPWIVVRAAKNWLVLAFMAIWLVICSGGILGAFSASTFPKIGAPEILILAAMLLFAWGFVGSALIWQLAGRSLVTVEAGALVTRWQMPLVGRTKRYDARQVRHLRAASLAWPFAGFGRWSRSVYPPWFGNQGSVQFDYGARTVRVLPGLDEAEGRMVAEWLGKRLPVGAVA